MIREKSTVLKQISFTLIAAAFLFALQALSVFAADGSDLVISGGASGTDYTYQDGELRIIKPGTYTISMANGVSSTTDRIILVPPADSSGKTYNLTFDNLDLTNTEDSCFYILNREHQRDKINITLKGNNSFSTEQSSNSKITALTSNFSFADVKISGSGTLNLACPPPADRDDGKPFFSSGSLTMESGNLICKNSYITTDYLTVQGGKIDVSGGYRGLYCVSQFMMNGGSVTLDAINYGIQVTGDGPEHVAPTDGIVINDGTLDINIAPDKNLSFGITLGSINNASVEKNMRLNMPGAVKIKVNGRGFGIAALNNASIQTLYMNNGELEVDVGSFGLTRMNLVLSDGYKHKNYAGASESERKVIPDHGSGITGLILANGRANPNFKYVLITPVYPITYDLDGGSLDEGASNPENYTRVDSFTLKNPSKESMIFAGWKGTGLDSATTKVTIAEGSKGARNYYAVFSASSKTITDVKVKSLVYNGKTQTGVPENSQYSVKNGSAKNAGKHVAIVTPKDGYTWEDGTTRPRKVKYTVAKAKLTATYPGETIEWYKTPKYKVKVTGFVGGESASTAEGYKAPSIRKRNTKPHKSYKLTPSGGAAKNYKFIYRSGTLTVKCKDIILARVTGKGGKVKLDWTRVKGATGYDIYAGFCGSDMSLLATVNNPNTLKYSDKVGVGKNRKYYVVAFRKSGGKKTVLTRSVVVHITLKKSEESKVNAISVEVNKKSLDIKVGKSKKIKAKPVYKEGRILFFKTHCDKIRYISSDKHIAKVDSKGKITGVRKGKCTIYAVAPNGIRKAVSITVK